MADLKKKKDYTDEFGHVKRIQFAKANKKKGGNKIVYGFRVN